MNIINFILVFLISFSIFDTHANVFYGTLRGDKSFELKSPYNGVVIHHLLDDGTIYENESPFSIESYEFASKKNILELKIKNLRSKHSRLQREYNNAKDDYKNGYISLSELNEKEEAIKEINISLEEMGIELTALKNMLLLGKPVIKEKFIARQFYTTDQQIVNAGDSIVKVETINKFFIDIKYDPVAMKGRIQDKDIKFRSLVTSTSGNAIVFKITNPIDNNGTQGAKIASLCLTTESGDLAQLLDTVFEVTVHDNPKNKF